LGITLIRKIDIRTSLQISVPFKVDNPYRKIEKYRSQ